MSKLGEKKRPVKLKSQRLKKNQKHIVSNGLSTIKSDYFARFRFDPELLKGFLKECSGRKFSEVPLVFQCLDDLGYWSLVRESETFSYDEALDKSLDQQFSYLKEIYDYREGNLYLWGDVRNHQSERYFVKITEKVVGSEQDLFRVEFVGSSATRLVSRYELDFWNAAGSSLPTDSMVEIIDWDRDHFWLKKLENFKVVMVSRQHQFNFSLSPEAIREQQDHLLNEIINYFALPEGDLVQRGRGLGLFACGQGTRESSALVLAFALQALGQAFGLNGRLWGTLSESGVPDPRFLSISIGPQGQSKTLWDEKDCRFDLNYRPLQRPLSEVLRKTMAAGPFGKAESLESLPEVSEPAPEQVVKTNTDEP